MVFLSVFYYHYFLMHQNEKNMKKKILTCTIVYVHFCDLAGFFIASSYIYDLFLEVNNTLQRVSMKSLSRLYNILLDSFSLAFRDETIS